jgi:lysozyme family protein
MAVQNREQSIKWVLQEERSDAPGDVAARWWALSLDALPPGLDYLMLECSSVAGLRVASGWLEQSLSDLGVGVDRVKDLYASEVLEVCKRLLARRRRRDRALPSWQVRYQVSTNRSNRVAQRMQKLVEESAYV